MYNIFYFSDDNGNFVELENALVPITCCKVNKQKTKFPDKLDFKNITACLMDAEEDYTNHDVRGL